MINGTTTVSRGAMFADMLDAPIAELTMSYDIDTLEHFINARAL